MSNQTSHSEIPQISFSTRLEILNLSVRSYNSLKRAGINHLSQIIELGESRVLEIRGLGQLQLDEIFDSLAGYLKIPRSELAYIDTSSFLANEISDIKSESSKNSEAPPSQNNTLVSTSPVLPLKSDRRPFLIDIPSDTLPNLIEYVTPFAKEILQNTTPERGIQTSSERELEILKRRFGLEGNKQYTLQEVGYFYDLTRERVRQIEARAIAKIKDVLFGDRISSTWQLPMNLVNETRAFSEQLKSIDLLVTEVEIIEFTEHRYNFELIASQIFDLRFLLTIFGFKALPTNLPGFGRGIVPAWLVSDECDSDILYQTIKSVHKTVNSSTNAISTFDLIIELNRRRKKKVNKEYVKLAAKMLIDVEKVNEENYKIRFEYLPSLADQAYRLLSENNKPLHLREIQREINHRLAKKGLHAGASIRSLSGQVTADSRFEAIGRSGLWSLVEWKNVHRKTIVELMEEFFHVNQSSATVQEIYDYVSSRRPDVSKQSIYTYLSMHETFIKVDKNLYELTAWGSKPLSNSKKRVTADVKKIFIPAVRKIFDETSDKRIPLRDLIHKLNEQTAIPEPTLYLHIQKANFLQIDPDPTHKRRKLVVFTGDPNDAEQQTARKMTLREVIKQEVETYLQKQPNRKASVALLTQHITKNTGCAKHTFYQYLSDMAQDGIVRKDYEDKILVCFLETKKVFEIETPFTFPQLEQFTDAALQEQLTRTLKNLTVDNVDLGLFQLGKIFENELKTFLVEAQKTGKYQVTTKDLGRLVSMIDCVERNGIVEKKHHLTLLREHRNERAHGEIPDLQERNRLMQHAPFLVDLYINYIQFFNEQRINLVK